MTLPSDQPDTASLVLQWDAVAEVNGYPVLHYEVWRTDNCADYETCAGEAAQVGVVDGVADPMYVDTDVATGSLYAYQVRAVGLWGAKGRLSEPVIRKAGVPTPPPDPNSAPIGRIWSADPLVVGDPVKVGLDDREIDYLARIEANPNQQATDPCVGYDARSDVSIPAWQWQRADAQSGDPNTPDGATWTDIDRTGYTGPHLLLHPDGWRPGQVPAGHPDLRQPPGHGDHRRRRAGGGRRRPNRRRGPHRHGGGGPDTDRQPDGGRGHRRGLLALGGQQRLHR